MFHEEQRIFVISKNRASSEELINRMKGIYRRLPEWIREALPVSKKIPDMPRSRLDFRHGSSVIALPRGAEQIREHTASAIFIDEAAFVPNLDEVIAAAIPAVAGGGRIIVVSTVYRGTEFEKLARRPKEPEELKPKTLETVREVAREHDLHIKRTGEEIQLCKGVRIYSTQRSLAMEIHHSAWTNAHQRALQSKSSLTDAQYLREYELQWDVSGEETIFRHLLETRADTVTYYDKRMSTPAEESIICYGFDWGFVSPSAIVELIYDPIKDKVYVAWEFYEEGKLLSEIAEAISQRELYYWPQCVGIYADPTIFQRRMPKYSWSPGGIGQSLVHDLGLRIHKAHIGPQARVHEIMDRLARDGEPGLVINPACENLLTELMNLRWDPKRPEKPDESLPSHAIDALGYGLYGIKWRKNAWLGETEEYGEELDTESQNPYDIAMRIIEMKVAMQKSASPRKPIGLREFLRRQA